MKLTPRSLGLALALVAALSGFAGAALAMGERPNPHADCNQCHLGDPAADKTFARAPAQMCDGCHASPGRVDHAMGLPPQGRSGTLPLTDGKIACLTCHEPHLKAPLALRLPSDQLCRECHNN